MGDTDLRTVHPGLLVPRPHVCAITSLAGIRGDASPALRMNDLKLPICWGRRLQIGRTSVLIKEAIVVRADACIAA